MRATARRAPAARSRLLLPAAAGTVTAAVLAHTLATRTATAEIRGHTVGYALHVRQIPLLLAGCLLTTVGSLLPAGTGCCGISVSWSGPARCVCCCGDRSTSRAGVRRWRRWARRAARAGTPSREAGGAGSGAAAAGPDATVRAAAVPAQPAL